MFLDRIVISGIGTVSPIGIGVANYWNNLVDGISGIKKVALFDVESCKSKTAGEVSQFNPQEIIGKNNIRNLDRTTLFSLCATKLAIENSNYSINEENCRDIGVVLGSAMGSIASISNFDKTAITEGPKAVNPALFPNTVINSPASQIAIRFNLKGCNATISSGFNSSMDAIDYAINVIQFKRVKAVVVGGVEELCEQTFKGFYKSRYLSPYGKNSEEIMAPFDKRRNGTVLGEGATVFVLESLSSALKREAKIYGEIASLESAGFHNGGSSNLKNMDAQLVINKALEGARLLREEIDYIECSANSTRSGDLLQAKVIKAFFNENVPVTSVKSSIGETFSAGVAFQLSAALMGLLTGLVHPMVNYKEMDIRCGLKNIPRVAFKKDLKNILVLNQTPQNQVSALIIKKYEK